MIEPAAHELALVFDSEPQVWGLRGDPYLWNALRAEINASATPATETEALTSLHEAFEKIVGVNLALASPTEPAFVKRFAHGGMSGGYVSIAAWQSDLMPLLEERARRLFT